VNSPSYFKAPILLLDGTTAAPSLAFASEPGLGIYRGAQSTLDFTIPGMGSIGFMVVATGVVVGSGMSYGWNSTSTAHGSPDLQLRRAAAATLQQGAADAASPVNQTLQAQGVAAGTSDTSGASYTFRPGIGRGSAVPAPLVLNRSIVTTTGSVAQGQQGAFIVCGTKTLSTTSAQAQTVVTVTTTTLTSGGLTLFYNTSATSATAADADTGQVNVSWNNVSGTVAATMGTVINAVQSNSSGTLASTPTVTVATNVVSIKLTPTWATIVPTGVRGTFTVLNQGVDPVSCQ